MKSILLALLLLAAASVQAGAAQPDLLIADFEGNSYGTWTPMGEALGAKPAAGAHPRQGEVKGFRGAGLVNTCLNREKTTGTLISAPFKIERDYIRFLIGGGNYLEASLNLIINGKIVRIASGTNRETLIPRCWDVKALKGQTAILKILDGKCDFWGHVNVDQIEQTDNRPNAPVTFSSTTLTLSKSYFNFQLSPVSDPPARVWLKIGTDIILEIPPFKVDAPQWISWDISRLEGKSAQLVTYESAQPDGSEFTAKSVKQTEQPLATPMVFDRLYAETYRPQFHFSSATNWLNDPNGLVYYDGEYHLFFQHNPYSRNAANMSWGHAVSRDLFHWKQLATALLPDQLGTIYSGSAVVDEHNTAGFQSGSKKPLVAFYTNAGTLAPQPRPFTQSLAYSNDRGRTWTKYTHNPVVNYILDHNRDPKVFWHEPTHKWIMALFLANNDYTILTSGDLKSWTRHGSITIPGVSECPDLFELAVEGAPLEKHWIFWGGNGNYLIGTFDGKTFTATGAPLPSEFGGRCYAGQTWNNIPITDGRRLFIGWMRGGLYPAMPFNQQMTVPREMSLRQTPLGLRVCMLPAREIANLRSHTQTWSNLLLKPGENPLAKLSGDLFDFELKAKPASAGKLEMILRGEKLTYDSSSGQLTALGKTAPVGLKDGLLTLRILIDRTSIEIFANDGEVVMSLCFLPPPWNTTYALTTSAAASIVSLKAHTLCSAWLQQ